MSENNYSALMQKTSLPVSINLLNHTEPGIFPVAAGNTTAPESKSGSLIIVSAGSAPQFLSDDGNQYLISNNAWFKVIKSAGTYVNDSVDKSSIGARAATGFQFMRAYQAPDAPDQVSYWQIISLNEVMSPTSVVDVLAISGNNVVFGHGTGAGITSWRHVAMLEGADFTGDITAPNVRGKNSVTVGDGTGGMALGNKDGAGFDGNNLNIKSWNGIGFQDASDDVIRAYISTRLGIIAASESVYAGSANMYKNGDIYGDKWSTGNGANWLSLYLEQLDSQIRNNLTSWTSNNFPTKSDVSFALSGKPERQYITMVGLYQNDKTKPFMLHDDSSGVFLATTDMLSAYATQNWVLQNFVQSIDLTAPAEVAFRDGKGYPRATDGAAMYNFNMVGGTTNVGNFIIRYTRKLVNNVWYVLN